MSVDHLPPTLTLKRARGLRRRLSLPEVVLWNRLRSGFQGVRFRRQHPIGPYILDFYSHALKLAVEIDGASHNHPEAVAHDARRTEWLAAQGIRVLRFEATRVLDDDRLDGVMRAIQAAIGR